MRTPGWDAKAIARVANDYYGGLTAMFVKHEWPERGSQMLPVVQRRVVEIYGSVDEFVAAHPIPQA